MVDLGKLRWRDFELLVGSLLSCEGYRITDRGGPGARGVAFGGVSPVGERVFVGCWNFTFTTAGSTLVRQFLTDFERYRRQFPNARGILIFSGAMSEDGQKEIARHPELEIWLRADLLARLAKHADLARAFRAADRASVVATIQTHSIVNGGATSTYATKLAAIPKGKAGWRNYELLGAEILTQIFSPYLGPPEIQERTDDGLDIMDAIFPIRATAPPWSLVRSEYRTRFVVTEFKNYNAAIGQREVESITQYLWKKAQRQFGMIMTRSSPSDQALSQRRRKWIEEDKMIVILTDENLLEMLQVRESGREPFDVIDAQLEDFLRTLSP